MNVLVTIVDDGLVQTPWGLWRVSRMQEAAVLRDDARVLSAALVVLSPEDAKAENFSKPHMQQATGPVNRKKALKAVARLRRAVSTR